MDIIKNILDFDKNITKDVEILSNQIENYLKFDLNKSIEFILDEDINTDIFNNITNQKGIYLFEVKLNSKIEGEKLTDKVHNFVEKYTLNSETKIYSSQIIHKRLNDKLENQTDEWLPIYIGKRKKIRDRIKQHINLSLENSTYAMKLKRRERLYGLTFRVSYIEVDITNYDLIMGFIESTLREKYKPIIGKQ